MISHYKIKIAVTSAFILAVTSCSNYKALTVETKYKLPEMYAGERDTTNINTVQLKKFFHDPFLLQLIDSGKARNNDLQAALQRVKMAQTSLQYAKANALPQVNLNASAGLEHYGDYTMNGVGNYDTNLSPNINGRQHVPNPTPDYFIGFRSSWEIDIWGKLSNQKKASFARFLASQSAFRLLTTELTAEIAKTYYQLMTLDSELAIIKKNIVLQENALDIVKIQKKWRQGN